MSFRFEHHKKILTVLESLDSDVLKKGSAYFGDGTLLALDFEEYRWSNDVDFIASVGTEGYKYLRTVIFEGRHEALFRDLSKIQVGRSTTEQYEIRMIVFVDDVPIKTEIITDKKKNEKILKQFIPNVQCPMPLNHRSCLFSFNRQWSSGFQYRIQQPWKQHL